MKPNFKISAIRFVLLQIVLFSIVNAFAEESNSPVTWEQVAALPKTPADHVIKYGTDQYQFAELRLPEGEGPFPVVVFIHGGCWMAEYDLTMAANLSGNLATNGIASWTPEYGRIGNEGGGWPGTMHDLTASVEYLQTIADEHNLDLNNVVLMGHSAGGHLVLWYAAKQNLLTTSQFHSAKPVKIKGVVSLAGITDIVTYRDDYTTQDCNTGVPGLLGGEPKDLTERVAEINPADLLPLNVPVRLVHGKADVLVPLRQSTEFMLKARAAGDDARVVVVNGAGHFDMIAPFSVSWTMILRETKALLGLQ